MKTTLLLALATTVVWAVYGLTHGGEFRFASWQTYLILSTLLVAVTVAVAFRSVEDFYHLAKWLIAAAIYRAMMCCIAYFVYARSIVGQSGAFITNHGDTVLWVVAILVLIVELVARRSARVTWRNFALIGFFLVAIQFNSRRLAWVSLATGLVMLYALFPPGAAKRQINRMARLAIPVVLLYVAVGWGRSERIFLPLRSLSTVTTKEDDSTLARNTENLGLIATGNYAGVMGTGWGRPYVCLSRKYDISGAFELWQYVPHNSILGLLAYTGIFGFAGFWLAIPTAVFLNTRVARLGNTSRVRSAGIVGAAQLVVCANQLYGDMGIFDPRAMYVVAISYAMALRLPALAGVWGAQGGKAPARAA